MVIPYSEIVNQDFQQGASFVASLANRVRKAYCQNLQNIDDLEDAAGFQYDVFRPARDLVRQYVCELPEDPVPVFPDRPLLPGNPKGCECDRMKVVYRRVLPSIPYQDTETRFMRAPISLKVEPTPIPGQPDRKNVGFMNRGSNNAPCLDQPIFTSVLDGGSGGDYVEILSIEPDPNFPAPEPCQRPVFPPRRPRTPVKKPPFTIPLPPGGGLPDIDLPVFVRPFTFSPQFEFSPNISLDVGGINFTFDLGGVNITVNPSLNVPVNFVPVVNLPILPPVVFPVVSGGGQCNLTPVLNAIKVVQDTANDIVQTTVDTKEVVEIIEDLTVETIVPLLKDIQECACEGESEQVAAFASLQTFTYLSPNRELTFAQVNVVTPTDKAKTFGVPGGETVAIVGWYAFGRLGRWGERKPLQFVNNLCVPPGDGYFNFTFSVYNGLLASGTVHQRKKE